MNQFTLFLLGILIFSSFGMQSQTVVFSEDFETLPLDVTSSGGTTWARSTALFAAGTYSDTATVPVTGNSYLTTNAFSTVGNFSVLLEFDQICKIEFFDGGYIEYSLDGGSTWNVISSTYYQGSGTMTSNKFTANSYVADWQAATPTAIPTNTWWKHETFDIGTLVGNQASVMLRFRLADLNNNGPNQNYGWAVDNIEVTMAISELTPPSITQIPTIWQDTVNQTGPFQVRAKISDLSGIDTAYVVYSVNGGSNNTLGMSLVNVDTFAVNIPAQVYNTRVDYYIVAVDGSVAANADTATALWFYTKKAAPVVIIGTGTSDIGYTPTYGYYDYGWSKLVYTASEIGTSGIIDSLSFKPGNSPVNFLMTDQKVFIASIPDSVFADNTMPDTSVMTAVFDGSVTWNGNNFQGIKLTTPFYYNGTDHLLIYWLNRDGTSASGYPEFTYTSTSPDYQAAYKYSDTYSLVFPTSTGTLSTTYRSNIKITFALSTTVHDVEAVTISEPLSIPQPLIGTPYDLKVKIKNIGTDTLTSATLNWELDGIVQTPFVWNGTLLQDETSADITMASVTFPAAGNHVIRFWTSLPDGFADEMTLNDTVSKSYFSCEAPLSGTYTIGAAGDFTTISEAADILNHCGISGPVVFNIATGTYNEQVRLSAIPGASAVNTVTFQSATGNYSDVTISGGGDGTINNYVVNLDGTDFVRLKNLTLQSSGAVAGYTTVLYYTNGATNNIFQNNRFVGIENATSTSANNAVIYSPTGTTSVDTNNVFTGNLVEFGSYGMYVNGGSATALESGTVISKNQISNAGYRGIYAYYQNAPVLDSNVVVSHATSSTSFYGLYAGYCDNAVRIRNNTITLKNSGYGLYVSYCDAVAGSEGLIANNMVSVAGTGSSYGIYDSYTNNQNFYYNSVNVSANAVTTRALYITGSTTTTINNHFINNILAYTGGNAGGMAVYVSTTQMVGTMDYNDLYSTGTNLGYWVANRADLAAWQGASGKDANSVSVIPGFFSSTNLHTSSPLLFAKGTAVAQVTVDIDNESRAAIPCIGADEFIMFNKNIALDAILSPTSSCAHTVATPVTIRVSNTGVDPITSFDAWYVINNGIPVFETVTTTIAPLATYDYTFTTVADLSVYGDYEIDAYVTQTGEAMTTNDTIKDVQFYSGWNFATPYTMGFEPTEYFADWSIYNSDGNATYKWVVPYSSATYSHTGTYSAQFYNSTSSVGEDWLFSRCFPFEAGKTYEISFWYRAYSTSSPQTITLKTGNSATPAGMTTTLTTLAAFTNTTHQQSIKRFTAPSTGSYYFGWLGTTGFANYAYIDDINISEVPPQEAAAIGITTPASGCGLSNAETLTLQIKNTGSDTINGNLTAYYQIASGSVISESVVSSIIPGDTLDFNFATSIDMSVTTQDSTFDITSWIVLTGDPISNNDTTDSQITSGHIPADPIVTNDTIPYGTSATLLAASADSVFWYADPVTINSFYVGSTFVTPLLTDTTTYYVESNTAANYSFGFDADLEGWTPVTPCSYTTYNWAWNTDGGNGAAYMTNPATYSSAYLRSPVLNTLGKNLTLSFRHRYATELNYDNGYVAYRIDGGSWAHLPLTSGIYNTSDNLGTDPLLSSCTSGSTLPVFSGSNNTYFVSSGLIPSNGSSTVEIAFVFSSDVSGGSTGWFIDEVNFSSDGCNSNRIPVTAVVLPPAGDFELVEIISPLDGCTDGSENVAIKFRNSGADTINTPFDVIYQVNATTPVTETVNYVIIPGDSVTHTFSTAISLPILTGDTSFSLKCYGVVSGDTYQLNDTLSSAYTLAFTPPSPLSIHDTVPYNTSATVGVVSPYMISWYDQPTGGNLLDTGLTYVTPVLYGNQTYYAQAAEGSTAHVGPIDNSIGSSASSTLTNHYMIFDVLNPSGVTLSSVDIVPSVGSGSAFTIILQNASTTQIASFSGTTTVAAGVKETINIDFTIPAGTGYRLGLSTNPGLYRNTTGAVYPYTLPGEISITGNTFDPLYYYFFYNWEITTGSACASPRTAVNAVVTGAPALDAGISEILTPAPVIPLGNENIEVVIRNYGTDTLTSADILWSVNGTPQTTFNWAGSLLQGEKDTLIIGSYNFVYTPYPGINNIEAWTANPNMSTDALAANDSAAIGIDAHEPYNGTYYIGTATPDFDSFTTAALALKDWGVDGPVTILTASGTYNESFVISSIPGASSSNRIEFTSLSGINTDVIIEFANTSTQNYVVKLDSADYITFSDISMRSIASATYGRVIELSNSANYNVFDNNIITGIAGSSNSAANIYSSSTGQETGNVFSNNSIQSGYYGIYFYGSSANRKRGNDFINNDITGFGYYGLYLYYNDSADVMDNYLTNSASASTNYHLYIGYTDNGSRFTGNTIVGTGTSTFYGIYLYYNNSTATLPNLVANNFVSQTGTSMGTAYGIYCYYSNYSNIYYNSVNIGAGSTSAGRALYLTGGTSNVNIVNNNLVNTSGGYAFYISSTAVVNNTDYNNLYTNGAVLSYWGADRATLVDLQTASLKNTHSVSVTPGYYSATDLHTYQFALRVATPLALVTSDIDGDLRDAVTPTIGADEYIPAATDAGITMFNEPSSPTVVGINDVSVTISNFGSNTLTSANIAWSLDGVLQTPYGWTGSLAWGSTEDSIVIGAPSLVWGVHSLSAWTELPNGTSDLLLLNDTTHYTVVVCDGGLKGDYTVGTGGDFNTINDAILYANSCGIDSVVVFNVLPGVYNEYVSIPSFPGVSSTNTVTFTSQSGIASSVTIQPQSLPVNNSVVTFSNAKYTSWENMTINASGFASAIGFRISNVCRNISIDGNVINMPDVSTSSSTISGIYDDSQLDTNVVISNNVINNGSYGMYIRGTGSATLQEGTVISGNTIDGFASYGMYVYYMKAPVISGNYIRTESGVYSTIYGMYTGYCDDGMQLTANQIYLLAPENGYGLYLYYCDGLSTSHSLVANNFIVMQGDGGSTTSYAVYHSTNTYLDFVYNSVNLLDTYTTSKAFYVTSGSSNTLKNNIIAATGGGFALYFSSTTSITESDYNDLYTSGTVLGYYSTNQADLTAWQTASAKDANSISSDPLFAANDDLHVFIATLNGVATPISGISTDIDGDMRDGSTPDIGADEFTPLSVNLGVTDFVKPANDFGLTTSSDTVQVKVFNYGATTATAFTISYRLNGVLQATENWSGNLVTGAETSFEFTTHFTPLAGPNDIEVFVSISGDGDLTNDTLSTIYKGIPTLTLPYSDNFESVDYFGSNITTDGWEYGVPTGALITSAYSPTTAWVTNLDGAHGDNQLIYLYTPVFSFAGIFDAEMRFYHQIETTTPDGGMVEYSDDGGLTWSQLGVLNDPDGTNWNPTTVAGSYGWSGNSGAWEYSSMSLSDFNNSISNVQFRFVFYADASGFNSEGWAIDNFEIFVPTPPVDAGVVEIINPTGTLTPGVSESIIVRIANFGTDTLYSIPVVARTNTGQPPITGTWNGTLLPGDTTIFTFASNYNPLAISDFTFCSYTDLSSDFTVDNDTTCVDLQTNVGIEENSLLDATLSPNPASEYTVLTLDALTAGKAVLQISSIEGKLVSSFEIEILTGTNQYRIETSHLNQGVYRWRVEGKSMISEGKLVITR